METKTLDPLSNQLLDQINEGQTLSTKLNAEAAAPPSVGEIDPVTKSMFDELKKKRQVEDAIAIRYNGDTDAKRQAEALRLSNELNIPVPLANRQLDEARRESITRSMAEERKNSPAWSTLLNDENLGPIAQDPEFAKDLKYIESTFGGINETSRQGYFDRVFSAYGQAWRQGNLQSELNTLAYKQMQKTASPQDIERISEIKEALKYSKDYKLGAIAGAGETAINSMPGMIDQAGRTWDEVLLGAGTGAGYALIAGQLGPQATTPEEVLTVPAAAITGAGWGFRIGFVKEGYEQLAGEAYGEAITTNDETGAPLSDDTAKGIAYFAGGFGAGLDLLPIEKFLKNIPGVDKFAGAIGKSQLVKLAARSPVAREALAKIARIAETGTAEGIAELGQEVLKLESILAEGGVTDESGQQLKDQRWSRYSQSFIGGFGAGAVFGAGGEATTAIYNKAKDIYTSRAETNRQRLVDLGNTIRGSNLNSISPQTIEAHALNMTANGHAPAMSAPVDALAQLFQAEGLSDDEVAKQFPELIDAMAEAGNSNAEVVIPAHTALRLVQMPGFEQHLSGDVRIGEDMTANEAKIESERFAAEISSMSEQDKVKAVETSIQDEVRKQLEAAGTERRAADTQAKFLVSVFKNLSERAGLDINALYGRYNLKIVGGEIQTSPIEVGMTLAQVKSSREFQSWFRDSKAVDDNGKPIVVFHGTNRNFSTFDKSKTGSRHLDHGVGGAFYFTSRADSSEAYANSVWTGGSGEGANILPAYLSIQNPLVIDYEGMNADTLMDDVQRARVEGHDGLIARNIDDADNGTIEDQYVVFDPTQIKSAIGNQSTYDGNNPNILLQDDETVTDAVNIASLDSSNALSKSQSWSKGRDLKLAIQDRVLATLKKLGFDPSERSPEAIKYLIKVGVKDALVALAQNPNAIGWYDVKTRQALAVMSLVHPEIMTDPNARFAFTWALAVTSNGIKVGKNFELADMVYRRYRTDGRMPTDVQAGQAQKAINESLNLFNELVAKWGQDNLRKFMLAEFTVSEITGINKDLKPSGEFSDTVVRGAAVLGPKIGNGFFSNLYGVFDALTMDRWLVRTWGRWTGTLIEINPEQVNGARDVLRAKAETVKIKDLSNRLRSVTKKTKTKGEKAVKPSDRDRLIAALEAGWDSDENVDKLAIAVQKASQEPLFRAAMNETDGGAELRTKGNNLAKYLDGQKEQPAGPAERNYIREIFQGVLDELRTIDDRYADLTMADLQAVLWYAEKRLYETAKEDNVVGDDIENEGVSGYEDEEAPDYANAAAAQARADGVPDAKIKATLTQEANRGSTAGTRTANQNGVGSNGQGVAGRQDGGAQASRGFTRDEKRSFIQTTAVHRIRSNRIGNEAPSWSYARTGGSGRDRPRVLKALGVRYVDIWKAGQKLRSVFKVNGIHTPTIYELETGSAENAARFVSAINEARAGLGPIGEAVKVYSSKEYSGMRLFLTEDGKAGFALKEDGDIISVFSAKGSGSGRAILETAIAVGGKKLDCFDTILPDYYAAHGFKGASRLLWNDEIAMSEMPSWDKKALARYNNGEPDVVFMVYDPSFMGEYSREQTPVYDGDSAYDEAVAAQNSAITKTLYQKGRSTITSVRGAIQFNKDRTSFKITLTGKANLSTFLHESGHFFLEVLQDLVERGEAPQSILDDVEKIRAWVGLKPGEAFGVSHHEKFARGFEAYLLEGRAPSNELQGIFNRFKAWLTFIYKQLTALNVELTDDVRGVMDRLVASDKAISEARTNIGLDQPLPKEALYLSDEEYDRYKQAWDKAQEEQRQKLDRQVMLEAARERNALWKKQREEMIAEETAKVEKTRGWRAWKYLSGADAGIKINPETVPADMKKGTRGMTASAAEGGTPFDAAAEMLGFNSGQEMLAEIAQAKAEHKNVPLKVKDAMIAEHGEMDTTAIADAAIDAVADDNTQNVLLTEYRAMARRANITFASGIVDWMKAQASKQIMGLTRRQLEPNRWRRAELIAAKKSAAAAEKGDAAGAAVAKRQQLMAFAMHQATIAAQKRIDTIARKLKPFEGNKRRAQLGRAGDLYLDAIDELLEGVQLKNQSAPSVTKLDRLQKAIDEAEKAGEPLVLPDKVRALLGKKNYADMTLEELEGIHDAVMNIWHLARLKNKLQAREETRELDEALDEMEVNARNALGNPKIKEGFVKGWSDRAASKLRAMRASLTKMEFLFGWLDGQPDGGLMHRMIYQPIADANKAEYELMRRYATSIIGMLRKMPSEQRARWEARRTFMGEHATGATIIAAALNLGNVGNREKLIKGYGWNEQRLMAEINAFMTKEDWDVVQKLWDEIDSLWPHIEATTKAATGLPPDKIMPTPVQTPFGEYRGGYYPVVYDPDRTEKLFQNQQKDAGLFSNNFVRPTLGDGFTKARVEYSAPILLDLRVISQHLGEVVHYVTHYAAITQADKITKHPRFQKLVKEHMGAEFYRQIRPWLQDIARNQDTPQITKQEPISQAMKWIRGGYSISSMGFNIFTGMKQLIGVTQSLDAIGATYWLSGIQKTWASPKAVENWQFAFQNSQELGPLVESFDRDIKMINDAYAKDSAMNIPKNVMSLAFKHIGWMQAAVNVATWHGAYEQGIAEDMDHDAAVMHADSVVRTTQSSGAVKDLSALQRGSELARAVSMFYSWFNVLYNRLESIKRETKSIRDVPRAMKRVAILVLVSAMIEEASSRAWSALMDDEEDKRQKNKDDPGYILKVLMKSGDTILSSLPLVRSFVSVEGMAGGHPPELTPLQRLPKDVYQTGGAIKDMVADGKVPTRSDVKAFVRSLSVATHIPVTSVWNLIDEFFGKELPLAKDK